MEISEEPNAVLTYSYLIQVSVTPSGLWVNKKYVHLGASPDGLLIDPNNNELPRLSVSRYLGQKPLMNGLKAVSHQMHVYPLSVEKYY